METKTDCTHCPFVEACPMVEEHQRLPWDEGGLELCPKLQRMSRLKCRDCPFCRKSKSIGGSGEYAMENGHPVYNCAAMHYVRMRPDGKIPATTPRDCPIKEAKRKNL